MPVSKKRKKERTKKRIYFRCRYCGKRTGLSDKGYCSPCTKFNLKVKEYAEILEAKGLL